MGGITWEMLMIVAFAFAGMRRKVRVLSMRWATRLALCQQSWPSVAVTTLCQPEGRCAWNGGKMLVQTVLSLCGQNQPFC